MMQGIAQTAPRLSNNDGKAGLRAAALAEIDAHLDNLRACVHWLIAQGVAIEFCPDAVKKLRRFLGLFQEAA